MVSNSQVAKREFLPNRPVGVDGVPLYLTSLALAAFLLAVTGVGLENPAAPGAAPGTAPESVVSTERPQPRTPRPAAPKVPTREGGLPGGAERVFEDGRMLVAYYGTAGTGSLGVLGEASPDRIMPRLARAAAPFRRSGVAAQPVFELIVTVARAGPTGTGTYSSDIARERVRRYIEAAHRVGVLVVLDVQPGRADFLTVVKRWEWALRDPWVGLALDPEWRVGPRQAPGQVIGSVSAAEVNRVSAWLEALTVAGGLPEKIFMLHQFRSSMIRNIEQIVPRPHLAMVQHVDGFGPPRAKKATFRAVVKPRQFVPGFKLFYDEDVPRMTAAQVLRLRPRISFVSFQ